LENKRSQRNMTKGLHCFCSWPIGEGPSAQWASSLIRPSI